MFLSRFQYIISNFPFKETLKNGKVFSRQNFHIQVHKSCSDNLVIRGNTIFFGECFDFEHPEHNHETIVTSIDQLSSDDRVEKINKLTGQFIFIFLHENTPLIFNDAAGQLEVFIYHSEEKLLVSSQPQFIQHYNKEMSESAENIPAYIREKKINLFGTTPVPGISKLVPNFYYDVREKKSERFFPIYPLVQETIDEIAHKTLRVLEKIFESLTNRKRVALAVTGGWDSRILFAASLKYRDRIDYFIFNHKTKLCDIDIKIAKQIADTFSIQLDIIDYDLSAIILNPEDKSIIWKNDIRRQKLAKFTGLHFPDHYNINGTVSEIAKNFYDPLPNLLSLTDISFIAGAKSGKYETAAVSKWMETTNDYLHLLDYIQWENKMPNWSGSARSITNLYFTAISPFNNRYLLTLLLSTEREARDKYFHTLYRKILNSADPRLTIIPINPIPKQNWIKTMKKAGIYPLYRKAFFKMRMLRV